MSSFRNLIALSGGFLGGLGFSSWAPDNLKSFIGVKEEETSQEPSSSSKGEWDYNWDKLHPVKNTSSSQVDAEEEEKSEKRKVRAVNHIILIRHGQYNTRGKSDAEKKLTDLGRLQAEFTGMRLAELKHPYTTIIKSTMTRAQETSGLIEAYLPDIPVESDSLLVEGFPVAPEPALAHVYRPDHVPHQDGPRIEAAFRKYVHRASPDQDKDKYSIIVCHANVIRYFVCRALQFPAEAWLRLSLNHASITWISVTPSGRVILRCYGETGHMLPEFISSR